MANIIYETLNQNFESNLISFHMPGHKNGRIFKDLGYDKYIDKLMYLDTTEIIGTDDLHNPNGIIQKSQSKSIKIINPDNSDYELRYMINGSTCGIMSSILSVCKSGEKIITNRACHQSVYNSCTMGNIEPIFVEENIDSENGVFLGVTEENYYRVIDENLDASAVFITRPTYYGMCFDVENIINYAHSKGMYVIVDEAHGAHFFMSEKLPSSSIKFNADFVIQSIHKTLPSMTQSSILLIRKCEKNIPIINRLYSILNMLETSSPSYVMMMSLELALDICDRYGKNLMEDLLENIKEFKTKISQYDIFETSDPTKIYINTIKLGKTGTEFAEILRHEYNIQVELSNHYGVLMLCSIANKKEDFDFAARAFIEIYNNHRSSSPINNDFFMFTTKKTNRVLNLKESFYMDTEYVELDESIGNISSNFIVPYPPGVCILSPGEEITSDIVDIIKKSLIEGIQINGINTDSGSKIGIIKNEYTKNKR